jgi:hypothetical protein
MGVWIIIFVFFFVAPSDDAWLLRKGAISAIPTIPAIWRHQYQISMESFRYTSLKCSDSTSATINADVEHQEATAPQSATNVMPCESAIIATEQQPAFPNNQTTILSPDLNSIFDITNSTIFKQMEEKITKQIDSMKELLKRKRLELGRLKEKKFEGGKGECLRIQAKAKTFLVRISYLE